MARIDIAARDGHQLQTALLAGDGDKVVAVLAAIVTKYQIQISDKAIDGLRDAARNVAKPLN